MASDVQNLLPSRGLPGLPGRRKAFRSERALGERRPGWRLVLRSARVGSSGNREVETDARPGAGRAVNRDPCAVSPGDCEYARHPHAASDPFGREEGVEELVQAFLGHADAAVFELDEYKRICVGGRRSGGTEGAGRILRFGGLLG